MARSDRIQVTVSPAMSIALERLAARTGLTPSTQAMVLLRQALDRTIQTAEVQQLLGARRKQTSQRHALDDMAVEHVVEGTWAMEKARVEYRGGDNGTQEAVAGAGAAVATPTT